jgi:hypothetical protein
MASEPNRVSSDGLQYVGCLELTARLERVPSGSYVSLEVEIDNKSNNIWQSKGDNPIHASYHWYDSDMRKCVSGGLRTKLPETGIPAGQSVKLQIAVQTPPEPGIHYLMLTMVHEGVCWFEKQRFRPDIRSVRVTAGGENPHSELAKTTASSRTEAFRILKVLRQGAVDGSFPHPVALELLDELSMRSFLSKTKAAEFRREVNADASLSYVTLMKQLQSDRVLTKLLAEETAPNPRAIFIHIPKCGGTSVRVAMSEKYATVHSSIDNSAWGIPDEQFFNDFCNLLAVNADAPIAFCGHQHLRRIVGCGLLREQDFVFASYRDPVDLVVSYCNYMFTLIAADPEQQRPDTRGFISDLSLDPERVNSDPKYALETITRNKGFRRTKANIQCDFLGDGSAKTAIMNIEKYGIEMVPLKQLNTFLRDRLGIEQTRRANISRKFVSAGDLSQEHRARIREEICSEDIKLVEYLDSQRHSIKTSAA